VAYRLYLRVGRYDFPELNDALVKARQILEGGGAIERIELLDGGSLGPDEIAKLIQERRDALDGWRRLT
jgi:hypothetical protein